MKKSNQVVSQFTSLTFRIYHHLGWNPIDEHPTFGEKFFFATATSYAFLCVVQECIWFVINLGGGTDTFLSLTNVAPCIGFVTLALVKIAAVYMNRATVKRIFEKLESLCWETRLTVENEKTIKTSLRMMKVLSVDYVILIWMFNLMPFVIIIIKFCTDGIYFKSMPYFLWYPWNVFDPLVYEICYIVLMWGGWICAIGILGTDLMFCMIVTFLNIQLISLGSEIKRIVRREAPEVELRKWINDHNELLHMAEEIEGIFSWTILINFVGSPVILCLVGIQTIVR